MVVAVAKQSSRKHWQSSETPGGQRKDIFQIIIVHDRKRRKEVKGLVASEKNGIRKRLS